MVPITTTMRTIAFLVCQENSTTMKEAILLMHVKIVFKELSMQFRENKNAKIVRKVNILVKVDFNLVKIAQSVRLHQRKAFETSMNVNYVQMDIGDEQQVKKIVNHVKLGCMEMLLVVRLLPALVQTAMREKQRPILAKIPV